MSWADDIRCLYCDGKLPLYKKITNGQFCSSGHQKAYWYEQERLAIERLRDSYPSAAATRHQAVSESLVSDDAVTQIEADPHYLYVGVGDPAASTGKPASFAGGEPDLRGLIPERSPLPVMYVSLLPVTGLVSAEPFPYVINLNLSLGAARFWQPGFAGAGLLPKARPVKNAMPRPSWHGAQIETTEIIPILGTLQPVIRLMSPMVGSAPPLHGPSLSAATVLRISATGLLELPDGWLMPRQLKRAPARQVGPVTTAMRPAFYRSTPLLLKASPVSVQPGSPRVEQARPASHLEQIGRTAEEPAAHADRLHALPRILASSPLARPAPIEEAMDTVALHLEVRPQLPTSGILQPVWSSTLGFAGLRQLVFTKAPVDDFHPFLAEVAPLAVKSEAPQLRLETHAQGPMLRAAAGTRYSFESPKSVASVMALELSGAAPPTPVISLPERQRTASVSEQELSYDVPAPAGPLPLNFISTSTKPAPEPDIKGLAIPRRIDTQPVRPRLKLDLDNANQDSDWLRHSTVNPAADPADKEKQAAKSDNPKSVYPKSVYPKSVYPWTHAVDFFKHAPRDLKVLAFAIPVLLSIALNPSAPKVKTTAPGGFPANIQKTLNAGFNDQWVTVRQTVLDRAAVALDEDFRSGLDNWMTRGDTVTSWGFDATGFVRPGPLALYLPSEGLSDYQLQFLGVIDKKALSWVVRAADFDNYYVIKLVVLKPGPLPTVGVTRYAVIHGKAQDRSDTILPINARNDMLYRVSLDVRGENFALAVQGQIVDNWSEPRLMHGGVGFFSARGEESRVRWVQVTHQYDMLGRLCAYLAPYNISTTDGSF